MAEFAREHLRAQSNHHSAENQFDCAGIHMLEQQCPRKAARQHERRQREPDLCVQPPPVFPGEDQIGGIAQQQVDRRDVGVGCAEAQDRREHERIGKAAQALDKICSYRRDHPQIHLLPRFCAPALITVLSIARSSQACFAKKGNPFHHSKKEASGLDASFLWYARADSNRWPTESELCGRKEF